MTKLLRDSRYVLPLPEQSQRQTKERTNRFKRLNGDPKSDTHSKMKHQKRSEANAACGVEQLQALDACQRSVHAPHNKPIQTNKNPATTLSSTQRWGPLSVTIHVITPVYRPKDEWLFRCIESVQKQTFGPVTHTLVVDGNPEFKTPKGFAGQVIHSPSNHNDYGDTPRSIGIQSAITAGASVIALLDDDNWFAPDHIERAIETQRHTGASLIASGRTMVDLDGDTIGVCAVCGTREFADTSAMLYFPEVFPHLIIWEKLESWMHAIGDRVVWNTLIDLGFAPGLTNAPTLNYRCTHAIHYEQFGRTVPDGVKQGDAVEVALDRWSRERSSSLSFVHDLIA